MCEYEEINILTAVKCVYNWLGYLSKASDNSKLIAESALKYPFVESLERHNIRNIHLEVKHPLFVGKRIDAFIGEIADDNIVVDFNDKMFFFEFKYVRNDTLYASEKQRYFNDLLRLSCLKMHYPSAQCYFMVCGESSEFTSSFKFDTSSFNSSIPKDKNNNEQRDNINSIYQEWLSFDMNDLYRKPELGEDYMNFFEETHLKHQLSNFTKIKKEDIVLKTKLRLLLQNYMMENSYSLGLWQIL